MTPRAISFGKLPLATPLLLSPLAGYTNLPFRLVIREFGQRRDSARRIWSMRVRCSRKIGRR